MLPKKIPKPMQGPGSSCPPLAVPPSRAPRGRAAPAPPYLPASRLLLPALLRLFLLLSFLLLSPSPCCLGLFMEIHSFMPSHRSLSLSLPPGGRACDASPLSSHFLLSQSGAAPARSGGRAGTRVGSAGPGERPPEQGEGRGHGPDRPWGHRPTLAPGAGRSGRPQGSRLCPPLSPSPRQAAGSHRALRRGHGWALRPRPLPGQFSPFLPLSARPSILS